MSAPVALPARRDVPESYRWDAHSIFATDQAWAEARQAVVVRLPTLAAYVGRLDEGPQTLADWFDSYIEAALLAGKVYTYANLFAAVDSTDQAAAAQADQARTLFSQLMAAAAFAEPELMAIGFDRLQRWTAEEPRLAIYRHYFARLAHQQAHVCSAEIEQLLARVSDPFSSAVAGYRVFTNGELTFQPAQAADGIRHEVAQGTIAALLTSPDRELRRTAWHSYADGYLTFQKSLANTLNTAIKQEIFEARTRRYGSTLEASLAPDRIPTQLFHNLLATFEAHLPTWHRYWRILRRAQGVERLHVYDIKAPLQAAKPRVPFAQAMEWICAGMAPLGEDYVQAMADGVDRQRWVDIYPNQGKTAGAFSDGAPGTHPFILMSYVDDLFSLSTLAHELGHSMHSYYTRLAQPYVYARYSLFAAEVASNLNQALVRAYLLQTQTDPAFQIGLIEEAMANFHRYFFIMPTLARFELEAHRRMEAGDPLTADGMGKLMADLFAAGYGEEVELDQAQVGITWAQFSHLYSSFYVYQYATGIAGSQALAAAILAGEPKAVDRYLDFLQAGSSRYPLDALAQAGVDLTSPAPVEQAFEAMARLIDRLAELLGVSPG